MLKLVARGKIPNPRNGRIPYDVKGYGLIGSTVEKFNAWLNRRAIIRYERLVIMLKP